MTTRPAAQCDQCKKIELLEPVWPVGTVPDGWLVLHGPVMNGDGAPANPRVDVCSLHCLAKWSANVAFQLDHAVQAAADNITEAASQHFWNDVAETDKFPPQRDAAEGLRRRLGLAEDEL